MGPLGIPEIIFIFVLALILFGPQKLPELGRKVGKALAEFRRVSAELRLALDDEMRELERHARELEEQAARAKAQLESHVTPQPEPALSVSEPSTESRTELNPYQEKPPDGDVKPA